jgi:hypothetical protein
MPSSANYLLGSLIDKLTNSIQNTISGDSFPTTIYPLVKTDLRNITKKNGWQFAWVAESKLPDRRVYKLTIENNPHIIQGLASLSDFTDHYYLHLVESAPFNLGKKKLYEGVPGNLFAFACKTAWDQGYEGIVAFQSKTKLLAHCEAMLGATHIGGHKMIVFPHAALKLIRRYFPS